LTSIEEASAGGKFYELTLTSLYEIVKYPPVPRDNARQGPTEVDPERRPPKSNSNS
jgi:hypothetical protein